MPNFLRKDIRKTGRDDIEQFQPVTLKIKRDRFTKIQPSYTKIKKKTMDFFF